MQTQEKAKKASLQRAAKTAKMRTKYAQSPQKQKEGLQGNYKLYSRLTGTMNTQYPGLKPEDRIKTIYDRNYSYTVQADRYGGLIILKRLRLN